MRHVLVLLALLVTTPALRADEFTDDVKRLAPAIGLRAGQTIADIGAGHGELSVALAKEVGESGRVYSTEMTDSNRDRITRAADEAGVRNITVLEAHATRTNLPRECCDAAVIRNVYHHFTDPALMNRSVYESIKPGGHVVVIDFKPRNGNTAPPADRANGSTHGVDSDTVVKELTAAGFERGPVTVGDNSASADRRGFMVVMRKPL